MARNHYGSTEHTEDTDILGSLRLEILEEIFIEMLLTQEMNQFHYNL